MKSITLTLICIGLFLNGIAQSVADITNNTGNVANQSVVGAGTEYPAPENVSGDSCLNMMANGFSDIRIIEGNASAADQAYSTVKYRVELHSVNWWKWTNGVKSDLYGFAGVRVYRVTNGGRTEIASFGNKSQYFFNTTEDNTFRTDGTYYFPKTATNQREFVLNESDFNNPAVDIEIELWHHIKQKRTGPNRDNEKGRVVYNLEELPLDNNKLVSFGGINKMYFKIYKMQ